ncbi:LCP family protein [Streptomyces sp. NRRL F-5135]|uniref:LCP family protein n=1 Tax=Streptomyces sp. NRRL F-5135 TaxID=1463858 RepID=UPI003B632A4B
MYEKHGKRVKHEEKVPGPREAADGTERASAAGAAGAGAGGGPEGPDDQENEPKVLATAGGGRWVREAPGDGGPGPEAGGVKEADSAKSADGTQEVGGAKGLGGAGADQVEDAGGAKDAGDPRAAGGRAAAAQGAGADGADGVGGGEAPGRTTRSRRPLRVLRWASAVLALLILGTAGAAYVYIRHLNGNLRSGERSNGASGVNKPVANSAGQTPLNILLLGSDSRAKAENVKLGGSRDTADNPPLADVQMLLHVSADRKNASVVSIPRDTRVDIPECEDARTGEVFPETNTIINETLARGGPGCTLSTWEKLTGVYIDHWMTIDFSGVVKMADAIGGVEVCVKDNIWDRPLPGVPGGSGLKLTKGSHQIQGEQALQWLRTRHAFYSDLGRAKAQHMYLNSMLRELKSQSVFTDTPRLTGLAEAATESLEVSEEIGTVNKLFDLAMQLKDVPTNRITMTTMPTVADPQDPNHLVEAEDAGTMWAMLRDDVAFDSNGEPTEDSKGSKGSDKASGSEKAAGADRPAERAGPAVKDLASDPADTGVLVRNGTGDAQAAPVGGRASVVVQALVAKGYALAQADATTTPREKTEVGYPSADMEGAAQAVATALGIPLNQVKRSTDVSGVTVVVGADWRDGTSYPKPKKPKAGGLPEAADAINGSEEDACMDVYESYRW